MPGRCARFELGTVDFSGYGPLTPTGFILRTQAAPGARVRDAVNYGDGAVLVFIRLRDSLLDGQPPGTSYPYLLPDGGYSATLVLNKDMLGHASDDGLELLARLLFPELNAFVKKVDSTPLDRTIRLQMFLHRRGASTSEVFYAGFQARTGRWFYSNDTRHQNAEIEVKVHTPDAYKSTDYTFTRTRAAGGGGNSGSTEPEHEDFDLHPETDDYWMLSYNHGTFYTAEFVKAKESDNDRDVNTSMVRWESSFPEEYYRSYTGYVFQGYNEPLPKFVSFDPDSKPLIDGVEREVSSVYQPGLLAIVNFRRRDLPRYVAAPHKALFEKLSKPLYVQLRDAHANLHIVQIDYLPADTIGDRNILVHTVPLRPTGRQTSIARLSNYQEGEHV